MPNNIAFILSVVDYYGSIQVAACDLGMHAEAVRRIVARYDG